MGKIDKRLYSKEQWHEIRAQRKAEKRMRKAKKALATPAYEYPEHQQQIKQKYNTAFVIGNGTSRKPIIIEELPAYGNTYGCNALYRTFAPDYLVAVDVKMILEISKAGYQKKHTVWTNPNKAYSRIDNLNLFNPSKGWSSGPTALWLAAQHGYDRIYILGFDYKGLKQGQKFNNLYADTPNYKKSTDGATFFGNWLRQTKSVIQQHKNIQFVRVITPDTYCPEELDKYDNYTVMDMEDFLKIVQQN